MTSLCVALGMILYCQLGVEWHGRGGVMVQSMTTLLGCKTPPYPILASGGERYIRPHIRRPAPHSSKKKPKQSSQVLPPPSHLPHHSATRPTPTCQPLTHTNTQNVHPGNNQRPPPAPVHKVRLGRTGPHADRKRQRDPRPRPRHRAQPRRHAVRAHAPCAAGRARARGRLCGRRRRGRRRRQARR